MKVIGLDHRTRALTGPRLGTMDGCFFRVTGTETEVDLNMTTTGTATETGIFITRGTARIGTTTVRAARAMTEFMFTAQRALRKVVEIHRCIFKSHCFTKQPAGSLVYGVEESDDKPDGHTYVSRHKMFIENDDLLLWSWIKELAWHCGLVRTVSQIEFAPDADRTGNKCLAQPMGAAL